MIEDTSDNPRREWYEEYPEPDVPWAPVFKGIRVSIVPVHRVGIFKALKDDIRRYQKAYQLIVGLDSRASIPDILKPDESVRDRALRLKQQPHSMAQHPSDFHYDHRGRRRY